MLQVPALGTMVGSMWRSLPPKKKAKYEAKAQKDRERYQREQVAHTTTLTKSGKPAKAPKDPNAPKKPTSSYMFFNREKSLELRTQDSTITVREQHLASTPPFAIAGRVRPMVARTLSVSHSSCRGVAGTGAWFTGGCSVARAQRESQDSVRKARRTGPAAV